MTRPIQRVLVTGASGFVMSNIIPVLLAEGCAVIALDRVFDPALQSGWVERWGDLITCLEREAGDLSGLQADAVLHGAAVTASPEESGETPEDNLRANLLPGLAALDWAREQGARAILVSSSAVYRATPPGAVSEDDLSDPLGVYSVAKQTFEMFARTLHTSYERDALVVRLSNIYGLGEQPRLSRPRVSLVGRMVAEALATGRVTVYAQSAKRDWTFAPDLGRALLALLRLERPRQALYNLASGYVMDTQIIARVIQSICPNTQLDVISENDPQMPLVTRLGWLSSQRLREETGFDGWTPFADGLRQVVRSLQASEAVS